jgi:hypothetical protein
LLAQDKAKEASPLLSDAVSSTRASPFPLPVWQLGEANSAYGVCLKALGRGREGDILLRESRASLISDPRPAFRTQASDRIRFRGNAKALQP